MTALAATACVAKAKPLDVPVVVDLDWVAEDRGSANLRDDVARAALDALATRGCFAEVRTEARAGGPELRLDVRLSDSEQESLYDDSLAEQANPDRPDRGLRFTAVFSVLVEWELHANTVPIERRRFKIERRRRPMLAGEDPSRQVRTEAVEAIGRELARTVCSVSRKKIASAIDSASR